MIVSLEDLKTSLGIEDAADDALLTRKIEAAEGWVASYIGETLSVSSPAPVLEAVRHVAEHLYEGGEPTFKSGAASPLPAVVRDLLRPYRKWFF